MTHRFKLRFVTHYPAKAPEAARMPGRATAHVGLRFFSTKDDGVPLISQDCASAQELDEVIDRLKDELEQIRKEGRARFADHKRREQRWKEHQRETHGSERPSPPTNG